MDDRTTDSTPYKEDLANIQAHKYNMFIKF